MEVELRLYQEVIKPDYQLMRSAKYMHLNSQDEEPEITQDIPVYAIEVKRTDDRATDLTKGLEQHLK